MTAYIGGLSSGLDTAAMIEQLMQVERAPIQRLQQNRKAYETKDQAWTDISTRLSSLRTALDALSAESDFEGMVTAESTNPGRLAATVTGSAEPQTLQVTVDQLATRHELISAGTFASSDSLVGAGTLTLTVDGVGHDIVTDASTTLSQLASSINDADAGVTASVIMVDESTAELRLVAADSGASSAFTATGDQAGLATFDVVRAGQDAELTMGSLTLTRTSNTISDLVPGVTLDLIASGAEQITVTVGRDIDGAVEAVSDVVEQLNSAIGRIKTLTSYNAETNTGGPLLGDSTARRILMELQSSLSSVTNDHPEYGYAGAVGIEIQRDGTVALDESKLRAALQADFAAVAGLLARSGSVTDSRLEYVRSNEVTVDGTYTVEVTQAADTATTTGAAYVVPGGDITFQVTSGSVTADVTVTAGSSLVDAIAAINDSLSAAGVSTVSADEDAGAVRLSESRYGSGPAFTVTGSGALGLDGVFSGADVQGTVGGEPATGVGRLLTADSGDPERLSVQVTATAAEVAGAGGNLVVGDVTVQGGVIGAVSRQVAATEGSDGSISRARDHWASQIELIDDRIERFEDRLVSVEERMIRQFTVMEQALAQLQSQQSWMQSQLAGLNQNRGS